jgi:hypothetical protein
MLELLDLMIRVAVDPDSVDAQVLEATWPNEKIAQCLEAVKDVIGR